MKGWFEVLRDFDSPTAHSKEGKYRQAQAVLSLMYLALGKDYPYNMAKNFQSSLTIKERGFSILKHEGKLASLLKEMETKGLLINVPDTKVGRRPRKFYKINPMIIQSLETASTPTEEERFTVETQLTLIEEFLVWLEESCSSDEKRKDFIVKWSFFEKFDFILFLLYLKEAALLWESPYSQKVPSASKTKKKLSEYLDENILKLRYKYDTTSAFEDIVLRFHGF